MSNQPKAVVVGLGPAGLTAAALLADLGWQVRGYEKREEPAANTAIDPRGYAFTLSPAGLTALPSSILRGIEPHFFPLGHRVFVSPSQTRRSYRYGDRTGDLLRAVPRSVFQRTALKAARIAGADLQFDAPVIDVNPLMGRTTVLQNGKTITLDADLVVAADGAFSNVRSRIAGLSGSSFFVRFDGVRYVSVAVSPDEAQRLTASTAGLHFFSSLDGTDVLIPTPPVSTLLIISRLIPQNGVLSPEAARKLAESRNPAIRHSLTSLEDRLTGGTVGHFVSTEMSAPYSGTCVVVGDAWNAIPAYSGQGVNAALQDVRALVDSLADPGPTASALERYARSRGHSRRTISVLNSSIGDDLMSGRYGGAFWRAKEALRSAIGVRSTYQRLVFDGDRSHEFNEPVQ